MPKTKVRQHTKRYGVVVRSHERKLLPKLKWGCADDIDYDQLAEHCVVAVIEERDGDGLATAFCWEEGGWHAMWPSGMSPEAVLKDFISHLRKVRRAEMAEEFPLISRRSRHGDGQNLSDADSWMGTKSIALFKQAVGQEGDVTSEEFVIAASVEYDDKNLPTFAAKTDLARN